MRVIIQTLGSAGDLHPFVGLGRALAARGHDVHVLACEVFRKTVEDAGLAFVECGDAASFERSLRDPDLWHPRKGLEVIVRDAIAPSLRPAYEMIVERIEPGNTAVVATTLAMSAYTVAETHDVPLVAAHLAPVNFRSARRAPQFAGLPLPNWLPGFVKHGAYRFMDFMGDRVFCPPIDAFRAELGLAPVRRVFGKYIHRADVILGLFPDWFAPPHFDWPQNLHLTGFPLWDDGSAAPLDTELEAWLDAGDAPLVFTAGSANRFGREFFAASAGAATALGRRAVLVTRNPDVLDDPLPAGVRHVAYAPFSRLFPRAAAIVHHGGIGSTAQGLAAGVPSVAAPMAFDQFDNASYLVELGAGGVLPMKSYTARRAAALLGRLLSDPACIDASRTAAEKIAAADFASAACEAIEPLSG